jgi:hypothetical protein
VARSVNHFQPGGIFRIRRLAWLTSRAGADRIQKRSVLVEALARSPVQSNVAQPGGQRGGQAASCRPLLYEGRWCTAVCLACCGGDDY